MAFPTHNPEWAVDDITFPDGSPNKVRPSPNLRQYGYTPLSFPTAKELNWQFNNLYQQIIELKSQIVTPSQKAVGELMFITEDTRNPSVILGYGTWERVALGRTIIGAGTGVDVNGVSRNFNDGSTVGEYEHRLTIEELPQHNHTGGISSPQGGAAAKIEGVASGAAGTDNYVPTSTGATGGNQAHNNIQPSFVCFIWKRTA